jgi:DNA-binding response OmpR family regulator
VNQSPYRILIADDEEHTRSALVRAFQLKGYTCRGAADGQEALAILSHEDYDLLLLDLRMPHIDGIQVMKTARELHPLLIVIILTAHASMESAITAVKAGAADYLIKPQSINDLDLAIQQALKNRAPDLKRKQLISFMQQTLDSLKDDEQLKTLNANNGIQIDSQHRRITIRTAQDQRTIDLTEDQTKILLYMNNQTGIVTTCRDIAFHALGYPDLSEKEAESMVRPHVLRIRRKIELNPEKPQILRTIRGCGYVFSLDIDPTS